MSEYMRSSNACIKALGGTGVITSQNRAVQDVDGAKITWHWWEFEGTMYEGSGMTKTTKKGVVYEQSYLLSKSPVFQVISM